MSPLETLGGANQLSYKALGDLFESSILLLIIVTIFFFFLILWGLYFSDRNYSVRDEIIQFKCIFLFMNVCVSVLFL